MQALPNVLARFPPVEFAFAYGSGIVPQKGYGKSASAKPMVDMILAVQDSKKWHKENVARNRKDYSALRFLGSKTISKIQERSGANIYFNPNVIIEDQEFKYGVINYHDLNRDLITWDTFYVSGRLHKPVVILKSNEELETSNKSNLTNALRTALLLLPASFSETDLYITITGLSYTGDIRMKFAENPKKARNIVVPNMKQFQDLYEPLIRKHFQSLEVVQNVIAQDLGESTTRNLLEQLPSTLRNEVSALATADNIRMSQLPAHRSRAAGYVKKGLSSIVRRSSTAQTLKGILTGGVLKSARYALAKINKRLDS